MNECKWVSELMNVNKWSWANEWMSGWVNESVDEWMNN